jgi:TonB family protein
MTKRVPRLAPARPVYISDRQPVTAAVLSVIPGLGQFYNGQSIKGFLFMDVALVNAGLLTIVLFAEPMATGLKTLLTGNHLRPNDGVLQALSNAHFGTPFSLVLVSMILLFVAFAIRDAYDSARGETRKPIYADSALYLSEAASGSYLFHFSAMISCAIFALFFLIPKPEMQQITEIEFTTTPIKDVAPPKPKKFSTEASSAKHRDVQVQKPTPPNSTASRAQTQPSQPAHQADAQPKQAPAKQVAAKQPPTKTAEPAPQSFRPAPVAMRQPTATENRMPTPLTAPRPVSLSPAANVTPLPSLTKSSASTNAPSPLLAMAPTLTSAPGPAPAPLVLNHSSSSSMLAPMPAAGKRAPSGGSQSGMPAPMSTTASTDPGGNPTPIAGAHGQSKGPVQHAVGGPTRIPSALPSGQSNPLAVGPVASAAIPRADSKGLDTESGKGKQSVEVGGSPNFGPYMDELQRRIKRNWMPPKDPHSRQVIVEFSVNRAGELGRARVTQSSGKAEVDQAALDAIHKAAPYPPLPKYSEESVDIQFTFDYRIFGGHASY